MKIGCAQDIVTVGTLSERARFLSDIGFDGMEVEGTPEQISEQLSELSGILTNQIIEISAICGLHRGWLIGLYIVMGIMPQVLMMVVVLGALDPWLDFRGRVQKI